jgi:hypothetical protein
MSLPSFALAAASMSPPARSLLILTANSRDSFFERMNTNSRSPTTMSEASIITAMTATMPFAKMPMWAQMSPIVNCMTLFSVRLT